MGIDTSEMLDAMAAVGEHQRSLYYQMVAALPSFPMKPLRWFENWAIPHLISAHHSAKAMSDESPVKRECLRDCEKAIHHITSLEDSLISIGASCLTVMDPVGSVYAFCTGKKTIGGCSLYNQNLEAERLVNQRSPYSRFGKVVGCGAGVATWVAFPAAAAIIAAVLTVVNVAVLAVKHRGRGMFYNPAQKESIL